MSLFSKIRYLCPVCNYLLDRAPDHFAICPSCGVEFGVDTVDHSILELRRVWLDNGARWASAVDPEPKHFDGLLQLAGIPNPVLVRQPNVEAKTFRFAPEFADYRILGLVTINA